MAIRRFGQFQGEDIHEITLDDGAGVNASILTYGASVRDLVVPVATGVRRVVLGYNSVEDYAAHGSHAGAVAGRFANRIAGGRFTIDGVDHQVVCNQAGQHSLHGGGKPHGFGVRPWTVLAHDARSVTLGLHSPDGDGGFPGALDVVCTYRLTGAATFAISLRAMTSRASVVNLAQHAYFNLAGGGDVLDHELELSAGFYTPVDADLIPTGEVRSVAGTPFDFRSRRPLRYPVEGGLQAYDHNFVLDGPRGTLRHAASLHARAGDLTMQVWTTEPAIQLYDAAKMNPPVAGLDGAQYGPRAGLCLECQTFPDAPNRGHFPSALLRPGEVYRQETEWRFSR